MKHLFLLSLIIFFFEGCTPTANQQYVITPPQSDTPTDSSSSSVSKNQPKTVSIQELYTTIENLKQELEEKKKKDDSVKKLQETISYHEYVLMEMMNEITTLNQFKKRQEENKRRTRFMVPMIKKEKTMVSPEVPKQMVTVKASKPMVQVAQPPKKKNVVLPNSLVEVETRPGSYKLLQDAVIIDNNGKTIFNWEKLRTFTSNKMRGEYLK
jgi:TolA-binding protein